MIGHEVQREDGRPPPVLDWICQRELADMFDISPRTAASRAAAGKLHAYEHGVPNCGRRKYSRLLVERVIRHRWEEAIRRQDKLLDKDGIEEV